MAIPKALQDRLREGRLIPFVGAGVSMRVLDRISKEPVFPSWRQLLNSAADRLDQEMKTAEAQVVRSLLKMHRPDFLYAATQARDALGSVWYEFLKEKIDIQFATIAVILTRLNRRKEAYDLISHFVVLAQGPVRRQLEHLEAQLLSQTIRPGFRQPPKKRKRRIKKKRR